MLSSVELFHKFQKFIERGEFELENPNFRKEYASSGLGLEMGYYSLSKTDLFVGGTKRGRLIKKPGKHFCGYEYCFLGDRLQIAKCLVDGKDRNIIFLEYEDDYRYGYIFDYLGKLEPNRCFAYEMDGGTIIGFKTFSYYPKNDILKEDIIREEKYFYTDGELCSIGEKLTHFDFFSEKERLLSEDVYDYFNGKFWVPSRCVAKDKNQTNNISSIVYDNQKKLCNKLKKSIKLDMSLDQVIQAFFSVVSEAKPNNEEMLLYEVGCRSVAKDIKACFFCLIRQIPSPDGEYYQMILELQYDVCDEVSSLSECEWHKQGDNDLYEYVFKSEAYRVLKNMIIKKVNVWVDET